ncbi:DUF2515 family protein [Pseudalkalibacillus berkeleyi]|uniref:DUF2515 domain-containing protein n=1 Tax=Pseudalkalibacillus berkeleyi TaxID=1069813 RepID=A0ABS9H0V5_9BACL|nr:DUF2515 family protein [Pseudalkalibacillus berkeleyi]MCF6137465.1 DUF2515 domain-containing protein [Pseudalkalibacillus berkeleyi]
MSRDKVTLNKEHVEIIKRIKEQTEHFNTNNVTRTMAYLHFYNNNREIHWAFLAHMVSRNAGWNMTDLKGEFLPRLLSEKERKDLFMWLERGNWLIFQDAYPQLLLYELSKHREQPMFFLLPHIHISQFMENIWMQFWDAGDSARLTMGLIINEQMYIESRIIQNDYYQNKVMNKPAFTLQEWFNLNVILFPSIFSSNGHCDLYGQVVHNFERIQERIKIGKKLYSILFHQPKHLNNVYYWALEQRHTGSRKDYWPHIFNDVSESFPGRIYNPHIQDCNLKEGVSKLFSPQLKYAWPDIIHDAPGYEDWFKDMDINDELQPISKEVNGSIEHHYCKSLEKLSLAVLTNKAFFQRR